jgi:hypothetical protein
LMHSSGGLVPPSGPCGSGCWSRPLWCPCYGAEHVPPNPVAKSSGAAHYPAPCHAPPTSLKQEADSLGKLYGVASVLAVIARRAQRLKVPLVVRATLAQRNYMVDVSVALAQLGLAIRTPMLLLLQDGTHIRDCMRARCAPKPGAPISGISVHPFFVGPRP